MKLPIERVNLVEKDVEDWLYANPGEISTSLWKMVGWFGRQVKLPSGIADLVGVATSNLHDDYTLCSIAVVEVKNVPINSSALAQVCRYAYDMEHVTARLDAEQDDYKLSLEPMRIVVGPSIDGPTFAESVAMGVTVFTFEARLHIEIGGAQVWRESYRKQQSEEYEKLAQSDLFSGWVQKTQKSLLSQIPQQYRDIIKR